MTARREELLHEIKTVTGRNLCQLRPMLRAMTDQQVSEFLETQREIRDDLASQVTRAYPRYCPSELEGETCAELARLLQKLALAEVDADEFVPSAGHHAFQLA